jgi:F420-0:gamma-glutamyl ligase-like protein
MVPFWFQRCVVLTLTLKNIPTDLHAMLKQSAERNRRSLNSEILVRLESDFTAPVVDPDAYAKELKLFAARLPRVLHEKVARYKRQGRA